MSTVGGDGLRDANSICRSNTLQPRTLHLALCTRPCNPSYLAPHPKAQERERERERVMEIVTARAVGSGRPMGMECEERERERGKGPSVNDTG